MALVRHHVVVDHIEQHIEQHAEHELVHMRAVPDTPDTGLGVPQFRRVVARMAGEMAGYLVPGETFELEIGPIEVEQ